MTLFLGIVFSSCASTSTVFDIENLYSDIIPRLPLCMDCRIAFLEALK